MALSDRFLFLCALGLLPVGMALAIPEILLNALLWDGLLVVGAIADFLLLPSSDQIRVERKTSGRMALDRRSEVGLLLTNLSTRWLRFGYRDVPPRPFTPP